MCSFVKLEQEPSVAMVELGWTVGQTSPADDRDWGFGQVWEAGEIQGRANTVSLF